MDGNTKQEETMRVYEVERSDGLASYHDGISDAKSQAMHKLPDGVVATVYLCTVARVTQAVMANMLSMGAFSQPLPWDSRVPVRRFVGQPGDGPQLGEEEQEHGEGES